MVTQKNTFGKKRKCKKNKKGKCIKQKKIGDEEEEKEEEEEEGELGESSKKSGLFIFLANIFHRLQKIKMYLNYF